MAFGLVAKKTGLYRLPTNGHFGKIKLTVGIGGSGLAGKAHHATGQRVLADGVNYGSTHGLREYLTGHLQAKHGSAGD